jgi:hypothetical protein
MPTALGRDQNGKASRPDKIPCLTTAIENASCVDPGPRERVAEGEEVEEGLRVMPVEALNKAFAEDDDVDAWPAERDETEVPVVTDNPVEALAPGHLAADITVSSDCRSCC